MQNAPTIFVFGKDATSLQGNLAHLFGKRVVTSPQPDTTWAFMSYLIKQQNLKDVKLVHVAIGNEIPAVAAGRADYALVAELQAAQGLMTAFEQASRFIYRHPDAAVQVARKYFPNLPESTVKAAVQREIDAKGGEWAGIAKSVGQQHEHRAVHEKY